MNSWHDRESAGCNDEAICRVFRVADRDRPFIDEARMALEVCDVALVEIAFVNAVQALDVSVPFFLERCPVMTVDGNVKSIVASMMHLVRVVCRIPHEFLRHATDVDASSAQPAGLDDGSFNAIFSRPLRVREAAAATAYNQQIEVFRHRHFLSFKSAAVSPAL